MLLKPTKYLALGIFIYICTIKLLSSGVQAAPTPAPNIQNCAGNTSSYTATYHMPVDTYDVYVKLGQTSQTALTNLYYQDFTKIICQKIGTIIANGQSWTKLGKIQAQNVDNFGTFTLASPAIDSLPGANRPTVMLVSQTDPPCQPTTECFVTINGRQAILRASGTLLNEDSLHVVTATDPAKDTLIKANYYVDNTLVYTSKDLGPFDLRYVGSGQHTLATVANYTSNQQVLFQEQVNQAYLNGLTHDFFVIYFQHRVLLLFAGGIAILFLLTELWLILSGSLRLRLIKKGSHSASRTQVANQNTSVIGSVRQATAEFWYSNLGNMLKRLMIAIGVLFIALAMVVVLNTWVVQIYQVDGPSMQSTLFTGNGLVVNKLEKTWAQLSGHQYTPTRNQVVVFVKQQNVLSGPVGTEPPTYVVKRVIGLPGERVVVTDATITVYNSSHPLGFNPETGQKWAKSVHHGSLERIDITLRPDELFLVGDNRPESVDSRSYGAVKVSELVGQAVYRITPLNQQKRL